MTQHDPAPTIDRAIAAIDRAIDSALAERRIIGTVVLLAHRGKIVHSRAAGMADREAGREMTPDTWIRYASVSKPFTTVAALRLIQDAAAVAGRCGDALAAGLSRPALARWHPSASSRSTQLMAHLAGLDYGFNQPEDGPYAQAGVSDGISESQDLAGRKPAPDRLGAAGYRAGDRMALFHCDGCAGRGDRGCDRDRPLALCHRRTGHRPAGSWTPAFGLTSPPIWPQPMPSDTPAAAPDDRA
ncbi:serine hydrolase [Paracoccus sp. DMF-8]|uniref:serine hydrolase domain-containing protein n=1 Tax=Paracoccus sp. DMF-8 TaxID=3019445 RepID=UPI0023E362C5|nr:serine hydrolase domain-containing protein [Paracoccus sp. DMF-8]MDF3607872.1 serine hydrolase [Paracoccus sp. DMF-8]